MSQSPLNRELSKAIELKLGRKYCRYCNCERPAAGFRKRKGASAKAPPQCGPCAEKIDAKVAALKEQERRP